MTKKKSKDPWNVFVSGLLKRKRAKRDSTLPRDYILSISDKIWRTNPSKEIIYNTLLDMSEVIFTKGVQWKEQSNLFFRQKQKQHLDKEFQVFQDQIDDLIHAKNITK